MKTFRTLNQAKKDIQIIQQYINLIENYEPKDLRQQVIHTYALLGNITKTAEYLNKHGYSIEAQEITRIITSPPPKEDLLHKQIKQLYLKKTLPRRKRARGIFKN